MNLDFAMEELPRLGAAPTAERVAALAELIGDARADADRIAQIVRGLSTFAREEIATTASTVNAAIDISINMAMHELRQKASVSTALGEVPAVLCDEARLSRVLVNLLVNAAQAFPESDPVHNQVVVRSALAADGRVSIQVSDNGPGIAPEVLPRIFDPFFTTKPVGRGTGMGLSISHGIVDSLGGELRCTTRLGEGSTFEILLPSAPAAPATISAATSAVPHKAPAPTPAAAPRPRILVVDDDEGVLRSLTGLLHATHDVIGLTDTREALRLIEAGARFDAVLCDVMVPHLRGTELHAQVRAIAPQLAARFVFMTGGATSEDSQIILANLPNECLEKPFSAQLLRDALAHVVARG